MPKLKPKKQKPNDTSDSEEEISNNEIFKKLEKLEKALDFMSDGFDEMRRENEDIRKLLKQQEKENRQLKQKVLNMEKTIELYEWEKIENNIIISGVEKQDRGEDTREITEKILKKLKIKEVEKYIQASYRNTRHESTITVKLSNKETKTEILKARKEIGKINTLDCGIKGKNNAIYINEQLTSKANKLLYYARQLKKENKIKYAWSREGKIYIKQHDSDEKLRIREEEDLNKLQ